MHIRAYLPPATLTGNLKHLFFGLLNILRDTGCLQPVPSSSELCSSFSAGLSGRTRVLVQYRRTESVAQPTLLTVLENYRSKLSRMKRPRPRNLHRHMQQIRQLQHQVSSLSKAKNDAEIILVLFSARTKELQDQQKGLESRHETQDIPLPELYTAPLCKEPSKLLFFAMIAFQHQIEETISASLNETNMLRD